MKPQWNLLAGIVAMSFGVFGIGCYASAGTRMTTDTAVVNDTTPALVAVEPGIWIVSGQATPVYYANDAYWTSRGDTWYRSLTWNDGWVSIDVSTVPVMIVHRTIRYDDPPRRMATRLLPAQERAFPVVRHDHVERRVHHNEMGVMLASDDSPGYHKQAKRGHGRGR